MKKTVSLLVLAILLASILLAATYRTQDAKSSSDPANFVVNGDFETGTFEGWTVGGVCTLSNATIHGGLYSAYISDVEYDSNISQNFSPGVPLDSSIYLQAAIYPTEVGSLGYLKYPYDAIYLYFSYASTMEPAFHIAYMWIWNTAGATNITDQLLFQVNLSPNTWNEFTRNVAQEVNSYFTSYNLSDIVLSSIIFWYHYSNGSPGPFYVDDVMISNLPIPLPQIVSVVFAPMNPPTYVQSNTTRSNVPVLVTANVTEPDRVNNIVLCYEADNSSWWNTTMTYNSTTQMWTQAVPGQPNSVDAVHFFIQVYNDLGDVQTSTIMTYAIQHLPLGDINGDGKVDIRDIAVVAKHFGEQTTP